MATEDLVIRIEGKAKGFQDALKKSKAQTQEFEKTLTTAAKVSGVAFAGLTLAIGGTVAAAAKMESIHTQFETLIGNTERANQVMKELQDFSASTPFQFEDIARAGQQLLAFGFSTDELKDRLQEIGDVAAASGAPLKDVSLIYGQVAAAGKLTGERLLQLQERAIPIGPALAKTMGVAEASIKDLVSQGKVSQEVFQKAFATLSQEGGLAFNGMERQSRTLSGLISTLKDNFSLLGNDIGQTFLPAAKSAVTALTNMIKWLREHEQAVKFAAGLLAVGATVSGLVLGVSAAGLAFVQLRAAILAAGGAMQVLKLGIRGLLGATGIGLLIVGLSLLVENWNLVWNNIVAATRVAAEALRNIFGGIGQAFQLVFQGKFEEAKDALTAGFSSIKDLTKKFKLELQQIEDEAEETKESKREGRRAIAVETKAAENEADLEMKREFLEREREMDEKFRNEYDNANAERKKKLAEERTKGLKTEETLRKDLNKKRIAEENAQNAQYLEIQQKHGTAMAKINQVERSAIYQGTKQSFTKLSALMQSENDKLKTIGKIASIARIVINTAESASNVYKGFSTIPYIGQALGIAGAAAAVAFGSEQISKVQAAQHGGVITGGRPGVDSVPALLTPGELVVPRANFNETVGAVSQQRDGGEFFGEGGGGQLGVMIEFDGDEASQFMTARQNEDRSLGISEEIG